MEAISGKKTFKEKLEARWKIKGWWQIVIILFVFSVTGSLSVKLSKPVLEFLGIDKSQMTPFAYWPLRILILFPIYQLLLITIGTLCGQFVFFWNMEKKMMGRFTGPFKKRKQQEAQ